MKFNPKKFERVKRKVFGLTRKIDNKLKGSYGESNVETKVVKINKKAHKKKSLERINKNPNGTESLVDTMVHEEMHVRHPKMHEKTVRQKARAVVKRMGQKQKARLRNKYH